MSTIQARVDEKLKNEAFLAFEKMNISASDAIRMLLQYVTEHQRLPFAEISITVADDDSDEDILNTVRERLANPKSVRVNIDDI